LVTGGAGYIGAHVVQALLDSGRQVVIYDDFSAGLRRRVPAGVEVVEGDVHDASALAHAFRTHAIDGVVHLAAKKAAGESVNVPLYYYRENVDGLLHVLEAMEGTGVSRLVYSSSAAVYGTPRVNPVVEDSPLLPESPYGETKVVGEWMARDCGVAWGLSWSALRYFNVAGAASDALGDSSVNNLIPMVFRALSRGERPQIFGDDYPTPDGTGVRDYIHVVDLAAGHVKALQRPGTSGLLTVNLGTGQGVSVLEMVRAFEAASGRPVPWRVAPRRPGDVATVYADPAAALRELGWRATRGLDDMCRDSWRWQSMNPRGYADA
jgi:UDP-glucose 4-epimerase